jgi:DNA polymerase-1
MYTIAFDTETRGLDWFDPDQQAFMLSWADHEGGHAYVLDDEASHRLFLDALGRADRVVCHNLSFDVHQLRETWGIDLLDYEVELHDTDLMSRVVMPFGQRKDRGGHGLKNLATILVDPNAAVYEDTMKELAQNAGIKLKSTGGYYEFYRAYPDELTEYAVQDAVITLQLFDKLYPMLDEKSGRCYQLEMEVAPILIRAEQRGIALDASAVDSLYAEYKGLLKDIERDLEKYFGDVQLEGEGSEAALLEALQMIGVPLHRKTKTGKLSTNRFALQEFEDDFPEIATLLEYRRVQKFLSTYIGPMRGRDVVHTSFRQCEAWTGRMSSARPNLQNLPKRAGREVRRPLVARDGYKLVACDFDGIEARLLAYYMNDERYKQFFRDGSDPHAWMASEIHGGEPSDYAKGTDGEAKRNAAKNTLFAITYGAGAPRVADMNQIPKAEAKALISKIKTSLPKYRKLMGRIRKKVQYQGYVSTLMGRKQMINKDKAYVGLNALIQGTAADIMKQGVVNIEKEFKDEDVRLLLVVHDEAVVEAPEAVADDVLQRTCAAMAEAGGEIDPPLAVSGAIGNNYEEV